MGKPKQEKLFKPKVFVFEGPDVSGKSTQMQLVGDRLVNMGYKVCRLKYPMTTKLLTNECNPVYAKEIYSLLDSVSKDPLKDAMKLSFYNVANKFDTLVEIKTAIESYDIVLIDRYIISSLVYDYARLDELIDEKDYNGSSLDVKFCDKISRIIHIVKLLAESIIDALSVDMSDNENGTIPFEHIVFRKSKAVSALSNMCENREYTETDTNVPLQEYVEKAYLTIGEDNGKLTISNNFCDFQEAIRSLNEWFNVCYKNGRGHIVDSDKIVKFNPKLAYTHSSLSQHMDAVTQDILDFILKEI